MERDDRLQNFLYFCNSENHFLEWYQKRRLSALNWLSKTFFNLSYLQELKFGELLAKKYKIMMMSRKIMKLNLLKNHIQVQK